MRGAKPRKPRRCALTSAFSVGTVIGPDGRVRRRAAIAAAAAVTAGLQEEKVDPNSNSSAREALLAQQRQLLLCQDAAGTPMDTDPVQGTDSAPTIAVPGVEAPAVVNTQPLSSPRSSAVRPGVLEYQRILQALCRIPVQIEQEVQVRKMVENTMQWHQRVRRAFGLDDDSSEGEAAAQQSEQQPEPKPPVARPSGSVTGSSPYRPSDVRRAETLPAHSVDYQEIRALLVRARIPVRSQRAAPACRRAPGWVVDVCTTD